MQDQDRFPAGSPKITFAGGFVARIKSHRRISQAILTAYDQTERQLPDQHGAATDQGLPWLAGVAFIVCTSIAAWCAVAMALTGVHR